MDWREYQEKNYKTKPNYLTVYAIHHCNFQNAIDLGCGSGNDTVYMIRKGKNVCAIDGYLNSAYIENRLNTIQKERLILKQSFFEEIELPKTDFILAVFTLPFCEQNEFSKLWFKIKNALEPNGILVANFFGERDWHNNGSANCFTKGEVMEYLKDFEILKWKEQEYDLELDHTHWHYYDFVAKKR